MTCTFDFSCHCQNIVEYFWLERLILIKSLYCCLQSIRHTISLNIASLSVHVSTREVIIDNSRTNHKNQRQISFNCHNNPLLKTTNPNIGN